MKGREIGVLNYLRALLAKRCGFTVIELLIAGMILAVILTGLFMTLNIGQFSYPITSAKLHLQSEVRLAMDWIIKDLRQTISWNIASVENAPSTIHIKFNLWTWNSSTHTWELGTDYIEYDYDSNLEKLTRRYVDTFGNPTTLEFNNIIEAPFYTTYIGTGDPSNTLDADQLRNDRKLIIVISGRKYVRGSLYVPFTLESEVKIRNG